MDDPLNRDVKVPVNHTAKLCDVIAKWESQIITNNNQVQFSESLREKERDRESEDSDKQK